MVIIPYCATVLRSIILIKATGQWRHTAQESPLCLCPDSFLFQWDWTNTACQSLHMLHSKVWFFCSVFEQNHSNRSIRSAEEQTLPQNQDKWLVPRTKALTNPFPLLWLYMWTRSNALTEILIEIHMYYIH